MICKLKFRSAIESPLFQTANLDLLMQKVPLPQIGSSGRCGYSFTSPGGRWIITRGGVISVYTDRVAGGGGGGGGGGLFAIWVPRWRWGRASVIFNVTCGRRWRRRGRRRVGSQGNSFRWDERNNTDFRGLCAQRLIKSTNKVASKSCGNKYDGNDEILNCQVIPIRATLIYRGVYGGAINVFVSNAFLQSALYQTSSFFCGLSCVQRYALLVVIMPFTSKRDEIVIVAPCGFNAVRGTCNDKCCCYCEINLKSQNPVTSLVPIQVLDHETHDANYCDQHCKRNLQPRHHLFACFNFMEIKLFVEIKSSLSIHGVSLRHYAEYEQLLGSGGRKFLNGIIT